MPKRLDAASEMDIIKRYDVGYYWCSIEQLYYYGTRLLMTFRCQIVFAAESSSKGISSFRLWHSSRYNKDYDSQLRSNKWSSSLGCYGYHRSGSTDLNITVGAVAPALNWPIICTRSSCLVWSWMNWSLLVDF